MKLKIQVLQKDIRNGVKGSVLRCALALAIRRAVKEAKNGLEFRTVGGARGVVLAYPGSSLLSSEITAKLPPKAWAFISRFDDVKKKAKPINFTISFQLPRTTA